MFTTKQQQNDCLYVLVCTWTRTHDKVFWYMCVHICHCICLWQHALIYIYVHKAECYYICLDVSLLYDNVFWYDKKYVHKWAWKLALNSYIAKFIGNRCIIVNNTWYKIFWKWETVHTTTHVLLAGQSAKWILTALTTQAIYWASSYKR